MNARIVRAFAWMRWRTLVNGIRGGARGDAVESGSRLVAVIVPALLLLIAVPFGILTTVLLYVAGLHYPGSDGEGLLAVLLLRVIGGLITMGVVIAPLVRSSLGHGVNLAGVLLLPIPRRLLHVTDVMSAITDPWVAIAAPGLVGLAIGVWASGATAAGLTALLAVVTLVVCFGLIGTLVTYASVWLFRNRRRGEWISIILLGGLSMIGAVPMVVEAIRGEPLEVMVEGGDHDGAPGADDSPIRFASRFPLAVQAAPSELAGRALHEAGTGDTAGAFSALAGLFGVTTVLWITSGWLHGRLLSEPEVSGSPRSTAFTPERAWRIPGLSSAASAIAQMQARTAFRTLRGKLAVFLTPMAVVIFSIVLLRGGESPNAITTVLPAGPVLAQMGMILALFVFQPILGNLFAIDRAGLSLVFTAPIESRDIVLGKVAGAGVLVYATAAACVVVAALLGRSGDPALWTAVGFGLIGMYPPVAAIGVLLSAVLPKTADLNKTGKAGNPHAGAGLLIGLAAIGFGGLCFTPVLLARLLGGREVVALLVSAVMAIGSWVIALPILRAGADAMDRRRERLGLVASGR